MSTYTDSIKQSELAKQRDRLDKEVAKLVAKQRSLLVDDHDGYDQIQIRIDELIWLRNYIFARQMKLAGAMI